MERPASYGIPHVTWSEPLTATKRQLDDLVSSLSPRLTPRGPGMARASALLDGDADCLTVLPPPRPVAPDEANEDSQDYDYEDYLRDVAEHRIAAEVEEEEEEEAEAEEEEEAFYSYSS